MNASRAHPPAVVETVELGEVMLVNLAVLVSAWNRRCPVAETQRAGVPANEPVTKYHSFSATVAELGL